MAWLAQDIYLNIVKICDLNYYLHAILNWEIDI